MKKIELIISFIFISIIAINAQGTKNFIDNPYIEVYGTAEKEIIPDEIYISITINEVDHKGSKTVEELELKMIETLKKLGIDTKKDLTMNDYSSVFRRYWYKKMAIRDSKTYQLVVHSGEMAGKVFISLNDIHISNINIIRTDNSKIEEYKAEVLISATKAAKKKAQEMAAAVGQSVSNAIFIQEQQSYGYNDKAASSNYSLKVRGVNSINNVPELNFDNIIIKRTVFVRFSLK